MKKPYVKFSLMFCIPFVFVSQLYADNTIRIENPQHSLQLEHITGSIQLNENSNLNTKVTKERPAKFKLEKDSAVSINIIDTNPLLFIYNEDIKVNDSEEYLKVKKFLQNLEAALISLGIRKNDEEKDQKDNKALVNKIDNQIENIKTLKTKIEKLKKFYEQQKEIIDFTISSKPGIQIAKDKVKKWDLKSLEIEINEAYQKVFKTEDINIETILLVVQKKEIETMLSHLKTFAATVLELPKTKTLEKNIEVTDSRKVHEVSINISANDFYKDFLSDNAIKYQKDNTEILKLNFERESYVRFSLGLGMVYSFVDSPEYSVSEDENGNRSIAKSSKDYNKFSGALMLNIIPERLFDSSFEPYLQLGASSDTENVGVLLGLGFSLYPFTNESGETKQTLSLSTGVILQKVDKLSAGLSVGDSLETDSELKTEKEYKSGLYIMLGLNF